MALEMQSQSYPIIVLGMHRSGTAMLTRLLEELGLFVGVRKDRNHEAIFFGHINYWLLLQCGGSWDHPAAVCDLLENQEIRALTRDYILRYLIRSPRVISFLGWTNYLRYRTPHNLSIPWGWKSPLNTYTLPLWLDLFPNAKVIHIYRHGVDVAQSLRMRGNEDRKRNPAGRLYDRLAFLHWVRPKQGGFVDSVRCSSLEGGFSLWEEYLAEGHRQARLLNGRALELQYESFLSQPATVLRALADFCGLDAAEKTIERVTGRVKKERGYAYQSDAELQAFAQQVADRLHAHGY